MNKLMEVFDTTTKKVFAIVLSIAVLVAAGFGVYALTNNDDVFILELKKEPLVLEYGTTISTDAKEYLVVTANQEKSAKKVKVEIKATNQEGKEYPAIGKYEIELSYEKQKVVATVEVKDTKAPMFNETAEVTFEQGTDFDYTSVIKADDLQEVEYSFDTSLVNKDAAGEYVTKATAKDASGNETIKDVKVIVTAKPVVETPAESSGGSSNGNSTTSKPSSNGNSSTVGNSTNTSKPGTGNSGGNTKPSVPDTPTPPAEHKHINAAFGKYFATDTEAHAWAEQYLFSSENTQYSGYGVHYCSCGLHSLSFY